MSRSSGMDGRPENEDCRKGGKDEQYPCIVRILFAAGLLLMSAGSDLPGEGRDWIRQVPFTQVRFEDAFWRPRIETNRTVSIPSAFQKCEETGRMDNFALAGGSDPGRAQGRLPVRRHRRVQGHRGRLLLPGHASRSRTGPVPRPGHRPDRRRPGGRRVPVHLPHQPLRPAGTLDGHGAVGEAEQPRACTIAGTCTKPRWRITRPRASGRCSTWP